MALEFFDAKPYFDTEPIRELMLLALPAPNEEVLDRLLQRYHDDDQLKLIGALDDEENIQGIVGLRMDDDDAATILHLRASSDQQHTEISTALMQAIIRIYKLRQLSGRSHERNLGLYESFGFTSWVVGEKPPGTKWYGVRWERG
jgi:GNAT superfamily N-acetyltransferase